MRTVQRAWLASAERDHPHYWAPFIVSGQTGSLDLDHPTLKPTLPATPRGPRGCACDAGEGQPGSGWPWAVAVLVLIGWSRLRRRGGVGYRARITEHAVPRLTARTTVAR